MNDSKTKAILTEDKDPGIRILKISRPKALNALNSDTLVELRDALDAAAKDDQIRVLVLSGDGDKAFVAGADISEMKDKSTSEGIAFAKLGHEVMNLLDLMPKPTIAAVNGYALGGGTELAIACDFILASETAVFGSPEVALGILPGFGGTVRLSKFVGMPMAKELIYTGRRVKADEALRIGLVNHVYSSAQLMEETLQLAKSISSNSAPAVKACKELLNQFSESKGLHSKLDHEAQAFGLMFGTLDQREGMGAFLEKRKPQFQGL